MTHPLLDYILSIFQKDFHYEYLAVSDFTCKLNLYMYSIILFKRMHNVVEYAHDVSNVNCVGDTCMHAVKIHIRHLAVSMFSLHIRFE